MVKDFTALTEEVPIHLLQLRKYWILLDTLVGVPTAIRPAPKHLMGLITARL